MTEEPSLRLIALEPEDLEVISAHTQDSILRPTDMAWLPKAGRFTMIINRFNWSGANEAKKRSGRKPYERRRAALNFDRVTNVQRMNIRQGEDNVLELLAVSFETGDQADGPEGTITLVFAGGGMIRLEVECVEAQIEDMGAAWGTKMRPDHNFDDEG